MIVLTLPYPVSANRYWQSFVPRGATRALVHLSTEAKAFKRDCAKIIATAGIKAPIEGRVDIGLRLYPHRPKDWQTRVRKLGMNWDDSVQSIDLDNANKVVLDVLKGVAIADDKWVRSLQSERMEPDEHGARVVVFIRQRVATQPVQRELVAEAA